MNSSPPDFAEIETVRTIMERTGSFREVVAAVNSEGAHYSLEQTWFHLFALSDLILAWSKSKPTSLIAVSGLPGSGKTTLARALGRLIQIICDNRQLPDREVLAISLDDFYLSPNERQALGLRWRAVPGSHDLQLLSQFLLALKSDDPTILVPRYDTRAEVRLPPLIQRKPDIVLFDGWLIGARARGYEELEDAFDRTIFIEMDLEVAHQSRLQREARIREESNGRLGMSAEDTERFWQEALLPTGLKCTASLRQTADLIIAVNASHQFTSIKTKDSNDLCASAVNRRDAKM